MSLDVDAKRAMAIEGMLGMGQQAQSGGDEETAAGFYDEAARLMDAHAENAPDPATKAEREQLAASYRNTAQDLRSGNAGGGGTGSWEVTWTRSDGEQAPASPGAGWEPFGFAIDGGAPVVAWRRKT